MSIPKSSGKQSARELASIPFRPWSDQDGVSQTGPERYHFDRDGFTFDLLWHPGTDPRHRDRLFVLFSGDALRSRFDPPVFQRWTWASHFPGHCLFVSDPMLYLESRLGLAWYAGTADFDPLPVLAGKIGIIRDQLGLSADRVWSYGSSGGGFAAIRLLTHLPGASAIAINPQTCVTAYKNGAVYRYLKVCLGIPTRAEALRRHPDRLSLLSHAETLRSRRIVLVQNTLDTHHHDKHFAPFCAAMGVAAEHAPDDGPLHRLLFEDKGGHARAETPEMFGAAMRIVTEGES